MKQKNSRQSKYKNNKKCMTPRLLSAFLALVMVILTIPLSTITVEAEDAIPKQTMSPLQKYRAETTKSLEKITQYIEAREAKDIKLKNSFDTKIKKINTIAGSVGMAINAAIAVYNAIDSDAEWYENLGNIALELATSFLGVQLPGQKSDAQMILEEVQNMINDLEERLEEEFDAVNANIDNLSKTVDENSVNLAAYIQNCLNNQDYKNALNDFTGNGFNYYAYKSELAEMYNTLINNINKSGVTEESIKKDYDNLYFVAKKFSSETKSTGLYDYIVGSNRIFTDGYSIQEILYNYAVYAIETETPGRANLEIECIEFAEDLYDTYVFSQYALMLCYNYQLGYLYTHTENIDTEHYDFYLPTEESIAYSTILSRMEKLATDLETVNEEIARYICYVLNLESSFIYESGALIDHDLYQVPYKEVFSFDDFETQPFNTVIETINFSDVGGKSYYVRTNNKVSAGDMLYLNVMPEIVSSLFAIGEFHFEIDSNGQHLATVNKAGVVKILEQATNGSFTVTMYYNEAPMYSMTFEVVDRQYAGGLGTQNAPYLISEWSHIADNNNGLINNTFLCSENQTHGSSPEIYFELVNDIDAEGASFGGISDFKGLFDGNGHSIYGFSIENTNQETEKNVGFFNTNEGIIINLTLGSNDESTVNDHSFSVVSKATETSEQNIHSVGAIVGKNSGFIYNCFVYNAFVNGELYDNNNNQNAFCNVGGIAGLNLGTIEKCPIENSTVQSYLSAKVDSGDNNYAAAGGICGKNEGSVSHALSHTNKLIRADARGDGDGTNKAFPEAAVGGLIGDSRNGSVNHSVTYNNKIEIYASKGGYTFPLILKGLYIGSTKETFRDCDKENGKIKIDDLKNEVMDFEKFFKEIVNLKEIYTASSGNKATGIIYNPENELMIPLISNVTEPDHQEIVIESSLYDTNECISTNNISQLSQIILQTWGPSGVDGECDKCSNYWDFYSDYLKLNYMKPNSISASMSTNVTQYYQGETNFKYIEHSNGIFGPIQKTRVCPLSSHRIDTSNVGESTAIILSQTDRASHIYRKEEVQIHIIPAEISEIYIYTLPTKTKYIIGETLDTAGLKLFAKYNNDFCALLELKDCDIQYDFSQQGPTTVTFAHAGLTTNIEVDVASPEHVYETKWSMDENSHWYACANCEKKKDEALHSYDNFADATCNTCGYERIVEFFDASLVSYQVTKGVDGKFSLRAIAGLNSLDYANFGYEVTITTKDESGNDVVKTRSGATTKAYSSIYGGDTEYSIKEHFGYEYAGLATITNLAIDSSYTKIEIRSYVTTLDGTVKYGKGGTLLYTGTLDDDGYPSFEVITE